MIRNELFCRRNIWLLKLTSIVKVNLNEIYSGSAPSQPSFQSFQKTQEFGQPGTLSHNMDNESKFQWDEDVGNDAIGEPTHVIPNR